jgi:hypothetical protein
VRSELSPQITLFLPSFFLLSKPGLLTSIPSFDNNSITLDNYAGWAVNGSRIIFRHQGKQDMSFAYSALTMQPPDSATAGASTAYNMPSSYPPPSPAPSYPPPSPAQDPSPQSASPWRVIVGATVGGTLGLAVILAVALYIWKKKKRCVFFGSRSHYGSLLSDV